MGGGSVFVSVLRDSKLDGREVWINDADVGIASFWFTVFGDDDQAFRDLKSLVEGLAPCPLEDDYNLRLFDMIKRWRASGFDSVQGRVYEGFRSLFLNRTTFSGVASGGAIGGSVQNGEYRMDCRYNEASLLRRLDALRMCRRRVEVMHIDFQEFLEQTPKDGFIYLDPPYVDKGGDLYDEQMTASDHDRLAEALKRETRPFLLSYDDHDDVRRRYPEDLFKLESVDVFYTISGRERRNKKHPELLISKREQQCPPATRFRTRSRAA